MARETEDDIPESGAIFTFGKSRFADNVPSKFWFKNDRPLKICCGYEHTALITDSGRLYMFGSNKWGQLGLGSKVAVSKPTSVKGLKAEEVNLVACGQNHTLVYTSRGNVYVAGDNSDGQLGLGDCEGSVSFEPLPFFSGRGAIKMLAAGYNTSAVLTEKGKLFMWGDNREGQIGLGNESRAPKPREIAVGRPVSWVSCGYSHSAFITADGHLYMFGKSDGGRLGLPPKQWHSHRVPQLVQGIPDRVTQVACGGSHTIALTEGDVYSFGMGQFGQLGQGTFTLQLNLPKVVDHFQKGRVSHVMCGENYTAVITDTGLLYTFGDGRHGKFGLGDETYMNQFKPALCLRLLKYCVDSVSCGGCHMLVLARPRSESSRQVSLEEDDYLGKSYSELQEGNFTHSLLQRSMSARVRRRQREQSPEQFGPMVRTHLESSFPNDSLSLSNRFLPLRPPPMQPSRRKRQNGVYNLKTTPSRTEEVTCEESEDTEDNESVKDLGGTTEMLNLDGEDIKKHTKGGPGQTEGQQVPMVRGQVKQKSPQSSLWKAASSNQENIFSARKRTQSKNPRAGASEPDERNQLLNLEDSCETLPKLCRPTEVRIKQKEGKTKRTEKQCAIKVLKEKQISVENQEAENRPSMMVRSIPLKVRSKQTDMQSHPTHFNPTPTRVTIKDFKRQKEVSGNGRSSLLTSSVPKRKSSASLKLTEKPKKVTNKSASECKQNEPIIVSEAERKGQEEVATEQVMGQLNPREVVSFLLDTGAQSSVQSLREILTKQTEPREDTERAHEMSQTASRSEMFTDQRADADTSWSKMRRIGVRIDVLPEADRSEHKVEESSLSQNHGKIQNFEYEQLEDESGGNEASKEYSACGMRSSSEEVKAKDLEEADGKDNKETKTKCFDEESDEGIQKRYRAKMAVVSNVDQEEGSAGEESDVENNEESEAEELESEGQSQSESDKKGDMLDGESGEEMEDDEDKAEQEEKDKSQNEEEEVGEEEDEEEESVSDVEEGHDGDETEVYSDENEEETEEGEERLEEDGKASYGEEEGDEEESDGEEERDEEESGGKEEEEGDEEESDGEEEGDEEESGGKEEEEGDEEESDSEEEDEIDDGEEKMNSCLPVGKDVESDEEEEEEQQREEHEMEESGEEEGEEGDEEESGEEEEGDEEESGEGEEGDKVESGEEEGDNSEENGSEGGKEEDEEGNEAKSRKEEGKGERDEEEEGEEIEEESTGKRKHCKKTEKSKSVMPNADTKPATLLARRKQNSSKRGLQESQQLWNNILPQYLNLK